MTRSIDATTLTAITQPVIYLVWLIRLDIVAEPVYINSGMIDMFFGSGLGYDPALVGLTFKGIGAIGTIDTVTDSTDGSQALNLNLPGVLLGGDYLNQFITNADLWQHYPAYVFCATTDSSGNLLGKPFRVKSAQMDQITMAVDPDNQTGTLTVALESQQAYSGEALFTRYSEQIDIDNTDTSQLLSAAIANAVPGIGISSTNPVGAQQIAQNLANRVAVGLNSI